MPDEARRQRIARNEASFRDINETLERGLRNVPREEGDLAGFVCECAVRDCSSLVYVDLPKYEQVRADPLQFLVVPGHETPDVEDVVEQGHRYVIVRKHDDTAPAAEATDPRR